MTPRVEAWIRQAHNDLEAAVLTAGQGFHAQACYPQGDEAPADLFDANDSTAAMGTAEAVLRIAMAQLQA